jgi:hypothetical protein
MISNFAVIPARWTVNFHDNYGILKILFGKDNSAFLKVLTNIGGKHTSDIIYQSNLSANVTNCT